MSEVAPYPSIRWSEITNTSAGARKGAISGSLMIPRRRATRLKMATAKTTSHVRRSRDFLRFWLMAKVFWG